MNLELFKAATFGDAKFVREIPGIGNAFLSQVTVDGNSALHIAAKHGRMEFAMCICAKEPSLLTLPNKIGDTPLHLASASGHLRIVNLFIHEHRLLRQHRPLSSGGVEEDVDVAWMATTANRIGNTALHAATIGGHLSVVNLLLSEAPQLATMTNRAGVSALYMAAERGLIGIARRILMESPAVSHEGPRGQTALHAAVLRSYEISMAILGINPFCLTHQDASKSTPLHFATASGDAVMLLLLLQRDASAGFLQDEEGLAIIHIAASVGSLNMIKEILAYCPDALEQKNNKGSNFVHVAVEKKNLKVVKYVLSSSSSAKELLNEQDHEGNTPLHLAVLARDRKMIRMLLSSRIVDPALTNNSGFTPIDVASSKVRIEVSLRMYNIMTDLISYGSRFSPQRVDHLRNHLQRKQDDEINRYRALANNLAVIAVLIATVTFAAAFTLPGGYKNDSGSDEGMAILSSKTSFKAFLISDTLAMASSITVALVLIYSGSLDHDVRLQSLMTAIKLLWVAVGAMSVAFVTGVYAVVERDCKWVAVLVALIVCSVPLVAFIITYGHSADYLSMVKTQLIPSFGHKEEQMDFDPVKLIRQAERNDEFMAGTPNIRRLQMKFVKFQTVDVMDFITPVSSLT
ncbi:protein ACCELERATED CELL DEATH 6-like [Zingiber officinale]|uniref:protein ACCELERATED CELL DEATH 6-like n=1 Tax=Zingiber officinale TaxID=94328 RepID=UPI001C4BD521|nr:protein ACCELERATED CELL DEATH 6-like [Zingiber officinale]